MRTTGVQVLGPLHSVTEEKAPIASAGLPYVGKSILLDLPLQQPLAGPYHQLQRLQILLC